MANIGYLCFISALILAQGGESFSDEKRLIKHLVDKYERMGIDGRPVLNTSSTVTVQFGVALIQILDMDEYNQVLTTSTWHRYLWTDHFLRWQPKDYGNIDVIRVPISKIWKPDIVIYNTPDDSSTYGDNAGDAMAVITSDGDVLWIPRKTMKSTCSVDLLNFPWDTQTCQLKFGSWTYDGFKIDLSLYEDKEEVDVTDYIASNEWQLLAHPAKKNVKYYPCCPEPYPDLTFTLKIRRTAAVFVYALVLPAVLLGILTVLIFLIPPTMDSKINTGLCVFFSDIVLILTMTSVTPSAMSAIPLITSFLSIDLILITVALLLSVLTVNLARIGHRGKSLPAALRKIFNECIGCFLCVCPANGCCNHDDDKLEDQKRTERDWETFATVLDRIFLIIFAIIMIVLAIAMIAM